MTVDVGFEHAILQEYHKKGLFCRKGLALIFINEMKRQIGLLNTNKNLDIDLTGNQILSTLQLGSIAHIMMLI
ncbi:MAG: hypothetical protein KGH95_07690 [Thaumarchaeota archaeon]|nr:hypothetical protein [Nitrososphaerota archaeon]